VELKLGHSQSAACCHFCRSRVVQFLSVPIYADVWVSWFGFEGVRVLLWFLGIEVAG